MKKETETKAIKAFKSHKRVFTDYLSELEEDSLRSIVVNKEDREETSGRVKLIWHLKSLLEVQLP